MALWFLITLWGGPASAQQPQPVPILRNQPAWAQGVSPQQQKAASALLEEGNGLLKEFMYTQAEPKYVEALKIWKHPALYYNLSLTLRNLGRPPAEAYEYAVVSTQYGEAPLGEDRYKDALSYIASVKKENALVSISCGHDIEARLERGDQLVPINCQRFERLLLPGSYIVSASSDGVPIPATKLMLAAGERFRYQLGTESQRRWAAWKPWMVLGSGVALAVGGRFIHVKARDEFQAFDAGIDACGGCVPGPEQSSTRARARTLQTAAIGTYAVGGAAFVTGLALLYANRLKPELRLTPLQDKALSVVPVAGADENGFLASYRF
ncbi:uncharacterized protein STAUR_0835 [Stigmatella aurantiaca DW4/3-1]|uniref:Tetratricopeptide repeat domain protein n=2 Tax=Stigmatella aurantiaca (strain DW4/3-1) TaxID=378806 RepID=E3FZH4_STIAD|nr:uncharacterized protein STAUR_0835 [Stigmatella aurantiaca DW4/3-1]